MARMLAMAEVSCAGMVDLVSFGMVNAAMIRIMVTTISSSIRVNPRSRLRFRLRITGNLSQPPWPVQPCRRPSSGLLPGGTRPAPGPRHMQRFTDTAAYVELRGSLWISSSAAFWLRALVRSYFPCPQHRTELKIMRGVSNANYTLPPHFFPYSESVIWTFAAGKSCASRMSELSAGQGIAADFQSVEIAQHRHRDAIRLEQFVGRFQYAFHGHYLDALNDFVHAEKAVVVHFLPRQVRHARRARLQAQHQASLQLVLGALQFFVGDGIQFQLAKLVHDGLHDLGGRLPRRAGVHRQQPGIAEGIQFG